MSDYTNKKNFDYKTQGKGEIILLLHGLFGSLSNWDGFIAHFSKTHQVIVPVLPIYTMPVKEANLNGLTKFLEAFIAYMGFDRFTLIGNSLGGHLALIYTLKYPDKVKKLVLTGSSGLFENGMGDSFPRRSSYKYIKEKIEYTFYDPKVVDKAFVDDIFNTVNDIMKTIRIVSVAKSAQRNNMASAITSILVPTLLVWGLNDTITPPMVAHEFCRLIPHATLRFIDKCCHAPMMEHPDTFNRILANFL